MNGGPSRARQAVALLLACAIFSWGCTRTYVFHPNQVPPIEHGELRLQTVRAPHGPVDSYTIERIGVRRAVNPVLLTAPTAQEMDGILARRSTTLRAVEIDVGTTGQIWRDYGLAGAGVGMTLGLVAGTAIASSEDLASNPGILLLLSVVLGFNGLIAGATTGALVSPRVVDRRFGPNGAY